MAAPKRYEITAKGAMQWAAAELEHVGRIASVMDPDIQYAYAMSTLNGMAHLKDALFELVADPAYEHHHVDLQRTHDAVVRTMKHLKNEYGLDVDAIRAFNTRGTLSDLSYLSSAADLNTSNNLNAPIASPRTPNMNYSNAFSVNNGTPTAGNARNTRNTLNRMQDGGRRTGSRTLRKGKKRDSRRH